MADENESTICAAAGPNGPESPVESPVTVPVLSECSVYVMTCQSRTKIGIATNPEKRRKQIEDGVGIEVRLVGSRVAPSRDSAGLIERELHRRFADTRLGGEWFDVPAQDALTALMAIEMPAAPRPVVRPEPAQQKDYTDLALRYLDALQRGLPIPPDVQAFRAGLLG